MSAVRAITSTPHKSTRVLRVAALTMAVITIVLGCAERVSRIVRERVAVAGRTAAAADAPNVLLIILDTERAENLGLYGYSRPTSPSLDAFAKAGAVFDWAIAPSSWTMPSHGALFTGLSSDRLNVRYHRPLHLPTTLADVYRGAGYRTAAFVANGWYTTYESGLTKGFDHYEDYLVTPRQVLFCTTIGRTQMVANAMFAHGWKAVLRSLASLDLRPMEAPLFDRKRSKRVNAEFLSWLDAHGDRPFFVFLNFFDAHRPYRPPAPWDTLFSRDSSLESEYDRAIRYQDDQLGALFGALQRRGVLEKTLVVVTSDHGEQFGHHGLYTHSNSLYTELVHVPLVMRGPGVPLGFREPMPISLTQLGATMLSLTHVAPSGGYPAENFAGALQGNTIAEAPLYMHLIPNDNPLPKEPTRFGPMRAVLQGKFHYIQRGDGKEELYAYTVDAAEERDIAADPAYRTVLEALRKSARELSNSGSATVSTAAAIPHRALQGGAAPRVP